MKRDDLYDEGLLRNELREIQNDAARLAQRINLCRGRLVRADHHYMTNMLRHAEGAAAAVDAVIDKAEHELVTGRTVYEAINAYVEAHAVETTAPPEGAADALDRFRGPDGVIPDGVNVERELDLEDAAREVIEP